MVKYGGLNFILDAPVALLVTYLKMGDNGYRDDIQSASVCIQNMLLKVESMGIGSCWVCHLPKKNKIRQLLSIPRYYEIVACIVFGYSKQKPKAIGQRYTYDELFKFKKINFFFLKRIYVRQPIKLGFIESLYKKFF